MTDARAAIFEGPGKGVRFVTAPRPQPGVGEVLVRVLCTTICGSDVRSWTGDRKVPVPTVLGHEILGEVLEVAGEIGSVEDGRPLRPGERVTWSVAVGCGTCGRCQRGCPQKCVQLFKYGHERVDDAMPFTGGLADVCLLRKGTSIVRVPDHVSDHAATPASCALATAVRAVNEVSVADTSRVVVFGAGLVGLSACALAAARGARVLVVDPELGRHDRALRFGAMGAVAPGNLEDALESLDGSADAVIEASGSVDALAAGLGCLDVLGALALVGSVGPSNPWPIDPESVVRRLIRIVGVHNYGPMDLVHALDFLSGPGGDVPFADVVGATFPLERTAEALEDARSGRALRVAVAGGPLP